MDMMNQAERSFTNRHVLIQDDARFDNPGQYEADNSWDKWASAAPSVVPSRPSRSDLPATNNSFTGEENNDDGSYNFCSKTCKIRQYYIRDGEGFDSSCVLGKYLP
jgi:hypothetical protein